MIKGKRCASVALSRKQRNQWEERSEMAIRGIQHLISVAPTSVSVCPRASTDARKFGDGGNDMGVHMLSVIDADRPLPPPPSPPPRPPP